MSGEAQVYEPNAATPADWAKRINTSWRNTLEAVLQTGEWLLEAKGTLPHGEFIPMIEKKLPFKRQTAFRLMRIAEHSILSNVTHVQHLPPAWGTVYELTKAPDEAIKGWLTDGTIHPELERACKPFKPLVGAEGFEPPATKRTAV